jgi:hypothetical protein
MVFDETELPNAGVWYTSKILLLPTPSSTQGAPDLNMANATVKLMWLRSLLHELKVSCRKEARLWCDNMGAKHLSSNPVFHGRMKHIEIDYHFVSDKRMFCSYLLMISSPMTSPNQFRSKDYLSLETIST